MSEVEKLESLSNAEIRQKCMQYGLPNVPVTDTSRKILIRKLVAAMGDPSAGKKVNRRETIHSTQPMTPTKVAPSSNATINEDRGTPSRTSRRTIAVPVAMEDVGKNVDDKANPPVIAGRRRSLAQKNLTEAEEMASTKAAPSVERRRSVREGSQTNTVPTKTNVSSLPETINENEEIYVQRRQSEKRSSAVRETIVPPVASSTILSSGSNARKTPILEAGSLVILESDEEDAEIELVEAAEKAEKQIKSQIPTAIRSNSRAPSLSKTSTVTSSYPSATLQRETIRETVEEERQYRPSYNLGSSSYTSSTLPSSSIYSTATQKSTIGGFSSSQPRTSTDFTSSRYMTSSASLGTTSSSYKPVTTSYTSSVHQRPKVNLASSFRPSTFTNEQSDSEIVLEEKDTPYLSRFARNLERIKAENMNLTGASSSAGSSSRYRPSTLYQNRRGSKEVGVVHQFLIDLDQKYQIVFYTKVILLIVFIIFIYIMFS